MLVLKFDYMAMGRDLCDVLLEAADEIMRHFMYDVKQHLKSNDNEIIPAEYDESLKRIHAECAFGVYSILESYGTGSKMEKDNEALVDYVSSQWWNPARWSFEIVGRPAGDYINIFGEHKISSGKRTGEIVHPGTEGSHAISNAEKLLYGNGYVMRTLQGAAQNFFNTVDKSKYFHNEVVSK